MKGIPYKKASTYSYALGAYATIELLKAYPEKAEVIYVHSAYKDIDSLSQLCHHTGIPMQYNDAVFKKINQKENTYVLGVFSKYPCLLSDNLPHVVLVNPSDMGNLGTVIRTLAGFNITNLAIITPAADVWNPKVIRASMGAIFRIQVEQFSSFEEYRNKYIRHKLYPFMLDGEISLNLKNCPLCSLYTLIFGNEASGLPDMYRGLGTSVKLPQSQMVDSLNLSVAVGIASFIFASTNGQI